MIAVLCYCRGVPFTSRKMQCLWVNYRKVVMLSRAEWSVKEMSYWRSMEVLWWANQLMR